MSQGDRPPIDGALAEVFEDAVARIADKVGARMAALVVAEPRRSRVRVAATFGVGAEAFRLRYGLGVAGRVAETGLPIVVPRVRQEAAALA